MGWVLGQFGFLSGQGSQPATAVAAINGIFVFGVIGLLGAIYFSMQMKLDRKNHAVLLEEIARIKAGGRIEDVAPEARAIVEELTGWPYEQCWGCNPLGHRA